MLQYEKKIQGMIIILSLTQSESSTPWLNQANPANPKLATSSLFANSGFASFELRVFLGIFSTY